MINLLKRVRNKGISKHFGNTVTQKEVLIASNIPLYEDLLIDYNRQMTHLLTLQEDYMARPYSRRACKRYYEALYNYGYERQICEEVSKMGTFYYLLIMNKHIATMAYKYTPEFGERKLDQWKTKANFWFLPFTLICLFIHYSFNYQKKEDGNDSKKKSEDEEDPSSGLMSLLPGNFNEKIVPENVSNVRFKDVIGIDEYRHEIENLVDFLRNPKRYEDVGATLPKGVLLTGKPGVGKTLLARALAGEAGCSFFYKSGSDFSEMFVGLGALRVKQLFRAARKHAPSIIFIDEIDSVAGKRKNSGTSSSRSCINQILTEMDGFKENERIVVIAATNFDSSLDSAVKRPGRFDKTLMIPLPDKESRLKILKYYTKKITMNTWSVNLKTIASRTTGMTGADMKNLVNLAILNAIKEKRSKAEMKDFEHALDRMLMGITRKSLTMDDRDKMLTSYHEAGHTLMNLLTDSGIDLHKATILPAGMSLGHTAFIPRYDEYDLTVSNLKAMLDVAMGGRVAEEVIFGDKDLTTGCSQDLQKATEIANTIARQIATYESGIRNLSGSKDQLSDATNTVIDKEVERLLTESLQRTRKNMKYNKGKLEKLARALFEKETMTAIEIKKLLRL